MSKNHEMIKLAYAKGYRVTFSGGVINAKGRERKLSKNGRDACPYWAFSLYVTREESFPIKVHQLQAFQKFGDAMFEPGIVVRHQNENNLDNAFDNILLGTISQNALDRQPLARQEHAAKGNQKHSSELIEQIRADHVSGLGYKKLEKKYGMCRSTLSYYLSKKAKRTSFSLPF